MNSSGTGVEFDGVELGRTIILEGTLAAGSGGAKICLDEDFNLRCDDGEPAGTAKAGETFRLTVPESADVANGILLAEFATGGSWPGAAPQQVNQVLATPAGGDRTIDVLSTLVAVQMQQNDGLRPEAAWERFEQEAGLQGHIPLSQMRQATLVPEWKKVETVALDALRQVPGILGRLDGQIKPGAAAAATAKLPETVSRYVDPDTRGLLPTVTMRSLRSDLLGSSAPDRTCPLPGIVQIRIDTRGGAPVVTKSDAIDATITISGAANPAYNLVSETTISGRGNSTWAMPKKPYKLKLDKSTAVLGMPSSKKWALLANYSDKTMLRNSLAFCIAYKLGLDYTPQSEFAELTLNGAYQGLYLITNKTDEIEKLVEKKNPVSAEDGFVLEIDERRDADYWFDSSLGIPYALSTDASSAQVSSIESWINSLEGLLSGPVDSEYLTAVGAHFDFESFVDLYLVNEFLRNNDGFWSSTYSYRLEGAGQMMFGPVWDFDISAGNINYNGHDNPEGWVTRYVSEYYKKLSRDAGFMAHVGARWRYLSSQIPHLRSYIADSARVLEDAQQRNFARWPILDTYVWPNAVVTGSYAGEIEYLDSWLAARADWLDQEMN